MESLRYHIAWLVLVAACGGAASTRGSNAGSERDLDQLRAEIKRDKRKLGDLEKELMQMRNHLDAPAAAPRVATLVPSLPVEVVGPGEEPPSADIDPELASLGEGATVVGTADDGTEIVYVGDAAAGTPGTLSGDSLEPEPLERLRARSAPAASPRPHSSAPRVVRPLRRTAAAPPRDDVDRRYREALEHLRRKEHETSIALLRELISDNRDHPLADNAAYWLGEAYYDQKLFELAVIEFRRTAVDYPDGNKAPDALLKLGYSHLALGAVDEGRRTLHQLITDYPHSGPALLAAQRLETMETP